MNRVERFYFEVIEDIYRKAGRQPFHAADIPLDSSTTRKLKINGVIKRDKTLPRGRDGRYHWRLTDHVITGMVLRGELKI